MSETLPTVQSLTKTCDACPAQWEGLTTDDRQIYVRYRWGYLYVTLGEYGDKDEFAGVRGERIFGAQIGDELDGTMGEQSLRKHLEGVLAWPATATA